MWLGEQEDEAALIREDSGEELGIGWFKASAVGVRKGRTILSLVLLPSQVSWRLYLNIAGKK